MNLRSAGRLLRAALLPRSLPRAITITFPQQVKVTHDPATGIPTVTAQDAAGCAFGQGYVAALHRLWQMEQQRRVATGRMSEITGPGTREIDRWICWLGLKEAVEAGYTQVMQDPETLAILEQYAAGVNHFIQSTQDWGLEFDLLGVQPQMWTPKDSVAVLTLVSWSLAGDWEEQLVRMQTLAALGPEQAALLEADTWVLGNLNLLAESGIRQAFDHLSTLLPAYEHVKQQANLLPRRSGSNAWVVAGKHTASGKPILAGDPHLPLGFPGFFYEIEMRAEQEGIAVAGAALAGIPGIISGRNREIAWSVTVTGATTSELRLERLTTTPDRHTHTIAVKGQQPETVDVAWTARGPLLAVADVPQPTNTVHGLSLEWTGHRGGAAGTFRALWALGRARSGAELRVALQDWHFPVLTFVWAEVETTNGAYGWRVAGQIPLRRDPSSGLLPAPTWEPAGQWGEGYIPAEELPEGISPSCGYVVAANHRMTAPDYPYHLGPEYMPPFRAERITDLLRDGQEKHLPYTVEQAATIQRDQHSTAAQTLCQMIVAAHEPPPSEKAESTLAQRAIALLRRWDGKLATDSAEAALFKLTEDHLYWLVATRLFTSHFDILEPAKQTQVASWLGVGRTPLNPGLLAHWRIREIVLHLLASKPANSLIALESWTALCRQAFASALAELSRLQGNNPTRWSWGRLHQLELVHPLVQVPIYQKMPLPQRILKRLFRLSRGPYPLGGDEHSPWQTGSYPVPVQGATHPRRLWATAYQPAWRFIAFDGGQYLGCLPGGVSGHPKSAWADNQLATYMQGQYHQHHMVPAQ